MAAVTRQRYIRLANYRTAGMDIRVDQRHRRMRWRHSKQYPTVNFKLKGLHHNITIHERLIDQSLQQHVVQGD